MAGCFRSDLQATVRGAKSHNVIHNVWLGEYTVQWRWVWESNLESMLD